MSDVVTFKDVEGKFTVTVKNEFLKGCPNPSTLTMRTLNEKHFLFKFLHNPTGPAVIRHIGGIHPVGYYEFWVDGLHVIKENEEQYKKMVHDFLFNQKLLDSLKEKDEEGAV